MVIKEWDTANWSLVVAVFGMTLGLGGCSKVENKMIGNVVLGVLFLSEGDTLWDCIRQFIESL